ncbi:MAG: hypothetical protein ACRCUY_09925 [Thermoguttaceae bacterium]
MRYFALLFALFIASLLDVNSPQVSANTKATPSSDVGMTQLEADWLFQCDNNPTFDRAKQEIKWGRELAARIALLEKAPKLDAELAALDEIMKKIESTTETSEKAQEFYLAVRRVKREIVFKNPLIDFDKIVLIDNPYPKGKQGDATDEWGHEARHRNGFMAESGGRLLVTGLNPGGEVVDVLTGNEGSFWRPDVSFDGKKLLFSFQPAGEKSFHLYEVNADGSDLKQLTFGDYDDLDPIYCPDGKIVFCSSRQHSYVRCMPMTHSFAMSRCDGDGKNIYVISANGEPEYLPSLLNDGRVIFTRWEYTEKALWRVQSLWTSNPDGTNIQIFWGNQSVWPDLLGEARAIPNSNKVMFVGMGHHAWFDGSIGTIDPTKGLDYPNGLSRITREAPWPEVGNGPNDPSPEFDYHESGKFYAYKSPFPLSDEYFLASAREGGLLYNGSDNGWFFRLYMMDVYGNKELIHKGKHNAYYAMPLKSRAVPPARPDLVEWPEIGKGEKPKHGTLYSNDVFDNAPAILKEKGKSLRVIQMDPKTYTTWHKTVQHDGPAVSVFQADGVKRILGTIPIEPDGSVAFDVPPGEALIFQMLDKEGRAIHVMRSFASVMPGEVRGCFGCHETNMATKANQGTAGAQMPKALRQGKTALTPPAWGAEESISYARFVQPVLDKHCGKCHQDPKHDAFKKLNMTYRPSTHGWWGWVYHRPNDISPFYEPYYTMVSGATPWGGAKQRDERNVPKNIAGLFVVEGYGTNDPDNLKTLPPYSAYSPVSTLIHNAMSGEHNGVKVTGEDLDRLIAWVDCNGPFLGDEEIRDMFDPYSKTVETIPPIRPRIGTAPRINRFDLRQDGDTTKISGELRLQPNIDPNFNQNMALAPYKKEVVLKEVEQERGSLKVEIVASNYGSQVEEKRMNTLPKILELFNGTRFIDLDGKKYNDVFTDPENGVVKTLRIAYKINDGPVQHVSFNENVDVILPK